MSGPRMSNLWKMSMYHCNFSKLVLPPPLLSPSPARVSLGPLLPRVNKTFRKHVWGHAYRPSSLIKYPRAFYSESLPAKREDLAGRLGIMDPPADGSKLNTPEQSLVREVEQTLGSSLGTHPQAPVPKPLVLVISGPSGVGKDAVINRLKEVRNNIHFVVTATTRAKRPGETDGKDYFFLTKREFESMIQKNELLEHAVVYGDFKGIPKRQVRDCLAKGLDVVLRVDVQGAATVRSILGSGAVFIFLVAESEAALVTRLADRKTETKDKLLLRIATAREELKQIKEFDYVVVNLNGQLERTVSLISHIIDAEKARVHQRESNM